MKEYFDSLYELHDFCSTYIVTCLLKLMQKVDLHTYTGYYYYYYYYYIIIIITITSLIDIKGSGYAFTSNSSAILASSFCNSS